MMEITAKEYLEEFDKNGKDWSNETDKIAEVMEDYARKYHQAKLQNHSDLSHVSNQRELLNNFSSWLNEQYKLNIPPDEDDVNRYLKNYQ